MLLLGKTGRKLAWLAQEIAKRRERAVELVRRIEAVGPWVGGPVPGLRQKFTTYLHEMAHEREEEARLLSRVEALEKRHHDRLLRGRLSYARQRRHFPRDNPALRAIAAANRDEARAARAERKSRKEDDFLLLLIVLWYLFARRGKTRARKPEDVALR